jgi:hypothetical protein
MSRRWTTVFVAAVVSVAGAAGAQSIDPGTIKIKKVIADTLTPAQLRARQEMIAQRRSAAAAPRARLPFSEATTVSADTCVAATHEISTLPFANSSTTAGLVDDFNLDTAANVTNGPSCLAASFCAGGTNVGANGGMVRGESYGQTGVGPDRAYRIRTSAACTLTISADPAAADLALIVYEPQCSNSLNDCNCVDDTGGPGTLESVTLTAAANTDYFVVVDGYSGESGPFDLSITGTGCSLLPVELIDLSVGK